MQRFDSIEGWRAPLAWWVVFGHILGFAGFTPAYFSQMDSFFGDLMFTVRNGAIAVWIFMILSGYVITHLLLKRPEAYRIYLARRFLRLWPLHVVMLTASLLCWKFGLVALEFGGGSVTSSFIVEALMLQGLLPNQVWGLAPSIINPPDWSISLEWQFYIVAPAVLLAFQKPGRERVLVVFAGIALFSMGWLGTRNPEMIGQVWVYGHPSALPGSVKFFVLGIASRLLQDKIIAITRLDHSLMALLAVFAFIVSPSYGDSIAFCIWICIFTSSQNEKNLLNRIFTLKPMLFLGRISYSTYLGHFLLIRLVEKNIVRNIAASGTIEKLIWLTGISVPLIFVVSALTYFVVEKPAIDFGRRQLKNGAS